LLGLVHAPPEWAFPAHEHLNEWTAFLEAVVARYGDDITDWEIWNEPNLEQFWPQSAPVEGYFELVKKSYRLIKQKYPRATVLLGGMANQPSAFVYWEKLLALGVAEYCDALAYHPYGVVGEELVPILQRIRRLVPANGPRPKPLWVTEYGWGAWRHPLHPARSTAFAQLLRYSLQQELKISRPASIRILDDSFSPATEAAEVYESLRRQIEAFGWRAELVALDELMKFMQTNSPPSRDQIVMVTTNRLAEAASAALIDFIRRGGTVVMMMGAVPFPKKLDIAWTEAPDEEAKWKSVCRIPPPVKPLADAPAKYFLTNTAAPAEARYVPLLSAYQQKQSPGETVALFDYRGAKKGALIAATSSLTLRPAKRNITYHEQAVNILKTALVFLLEGGEHFFVYEFRDQEAMTKAKCYGLVEENFARKEAARALNWLEQQLGKGLVVRDKNYFIDGAIIELENLDGKRFVVTWGQEGAAKFKAQFMKAGRYVPETYDRIPAEKLIAGLEQKQPGMLKNLIVWREN